jgi:DNA polymerase III delta prime subunit
MTKDEILEIVAKAADLPIDKLVQKEREGRQIKANALFEGSSSPNSPRVPVGVFFAEKSPELAIEGALRRMALDVHYPEAIVAMFDIEGKQSARVFGYGDSIIAKKLASSLAVDLEVVPRPAVSESKAAAGIDASLLRSTLASCPNVILQGPPGTGKTSIAIELAREMVATDEGLSLDQCRYGALVAGAEGAILENELALSAPLVWEIAQMHPSYGYDDLVRRVRPTSQDGDLQFVVEDGLLTQLCELAEARGPDAPVLLVLDEINRCNLAATLGEFIFAIDPGHRSQPVRLQYQGAGLKSSVAVPPNLWIVGTMNTADRSIALVDHAVRRRFRFLDVPADIDAIDGWYVSDAAMRQVARELFLAANEGVEPAVMVGHSLFLVDSSSSAEWPGRLARQIVYNVLPTLAEYEREGLRPNASIVWMGNEFEGSEPLACERAIRFAVADRTAHGTH